MEASQSDSSPLRPIPNDNQHPSSGQDTYVQQSPSLLSSSGITSWAKNLKLPQAAGQEDSQTGNSGKSTFARFTSGLGLRFSPKSPPKDDNFDGSSTSTQQGALGSFTKGFVDTSKNAVKAVQVKARHIVSQNKRRYQEGGFDLDLTYITENIIAMGFPAGDMSSGFFGYVEGFYRNHMEEVIRFFETHHKGKYKVYNLCSERLYDASLLEGKVACFPFDDHNCPPLELVTLFCQSAYNWLKEDIENVVVVHCKAGMARTGLMISSLLLYLKFFPTAEESIEYYNQKRCIDGKGLVLPSQIRYVKYFERILTYFNGENQPGRRCMLRGFRLHRCPYWIRPSITVSNHNGILFSTKKHPRTKDLLPEDFWFSAPKKGIMVFALPGESGLTEVAGDFKINFHDRQGDFYWYDIAMLANYFILFQKRKLPSPGFQVEIVLADHNGSVSPRPSRPAPNNETDQAPTAIIAPAEESKISHTTKTNIETRNKDDVFSDSEGDDGGSTKGKRSPASNNSATVHVVATEGSETEPPPKSGLPNISHRIDQISLKDKDATIPAPQAVQEQRTEETKSSAFQASELESTSTSEFKAIAADASVFSFGDEDYESE
ncbi:phosphatidylinositol 3,4,5-trisphosphate 3-phosphatase and protein-tyrosine-phosphatase PTEN2A-like [Phalaenopsis equestris]|uniref:phosphatidylinositol 3,4,5-trisphosphate 3-phosphatase and protein-tyrosine-phosphatase PTEN2A-like n=1 Tax=Phalaenopsis equestris TaxID=78828 RepID=UPI0009E21B9A|nr:phosphatidylinositol 3,4,5-trisphosphate 3-phosphatase and protein-tyrosine-phosphatase PTEN2A-like [Phalaenopsis equestris]